MGTPRLAAARAQMAAWRPWTAAVRLAARDQWDFVPHQDWLSVAHAPPGVWEVEYDLCLLQMALLHK